MEKIIAYCGLICNECPAFIAAKNNDEEQKIKLAQEWSSPDYQIEPEEINCTGCRADAKVVFKFCRECEIRRCGMEKAYDNCAYCDEYPCSKLEPAFKNSPKSREILDEIKEKL